MLNHHPILTLDFCGLSDIYTLKATNFGTLARILTDLFPTFANSRAGAVGVKPAKLIVVDTFTDLFDSSRHPEYEDLKQRARDLRQTSLLLHQIASNYQLAVVLLGAIRTSHPRFDGQDHSPGELSCDDQERWFSRGHSLRGEEMHEALLGPIWSNQLNARIMMTRTLRMRCRHEVDPRMRDSDEARAAKRRRLDSSHSPSFATSSLQAGGDEQLAFRHLSVVFSSVAPVASCDYVILEQGLVAFPPEEPPPSTFLYASPVASQRSGTPWSSQVGGQPAPNSPAGPPDERLIAAAVEEEDEEESLWRLTQEQGDLFDQLAQEEEKAVEAEEGPPAEDHGASSDSDFYWDD
uniref:Serine/threonine-protein phosphatase 2A 56 kDa regulatory subunit n=1 Tax=Ganoderma boninense TaxID=34458 RepID=A0A5K1K2J4_9APHY|nr:Serine/threonine-protein phosphatase 2A 56 kDa regulatory subunit [Ganoderma boninense]